jgi:hypothetical protein
MILLWARHSSIQIEKPGLSKEIEAMKQSPETDPEEIQYWDRVFESGE